MTTTKTATAKNTYGFVDYYRWFECTNITDDVCGHLDSSINSAMEEYEKEHDCEVIDDNMVAIYDEINWMTQDFDENGKPSDILVFLDNLLVNHDFYTTVVEVMEERI